MSSKTRASKSGADDVIKVLSEKKPMIDAVIEKYIPRKYSKKSLEFTAGKARYAYDVETATKAISELVWDFLDRGGKRWRPALFLLVAEAVGGKKAAEKVKEFVLIPEVVHNGCVTGDTRVLKSPGEQVEITRVMPGDIVYTLSRYGRLEKNAVLEKKFTGVKDVYELRTRNRAITATHNHPFLVLEKHQPVRVKITQAGREKVNRLLKRGDLCRIAEKIGRTKRILYNAINPRTPQLLEKQELEAVFYWLGLKLCNGDFSERHTKFEKTIVELKWKKLSELKRGDLIVVLREVDDCGKPMVLPSPPKNPLKDRAALPAATTEEFCQLVGYLLGDGSISINKKSSRIALCVSPDKDEQRAYARLFQRVFSYSLKRNGRGKIFYLNACSYKIAWLLRELGLHKKAIEKTIPDWVFLLPKSQKLAFIRGYLDADGWITKSGSAVFASASKELIFKLKLLLDSLGFTTSHVCHRMIKNKWVNSRKKESHQWFVCLSDRGKILAEIGTEKQAYRKRLAGRIRKCLFDFDGLYPNPPITLNNFRFDRVHSIEYCGRQPVYDLMVENAHNFIANNAVVHNSLLVDDVEDNSSLRRGRPCAHKIYGVDMAINAGNAMYYLPLLAFLKNKKKFPSDVIQRAYEIYSQEMISIHFGQAFDIYWHKGKGNPTEQQYLQMCAYKTGTLARMSAKLGALLAGGSEKQIEACGRYAETIGVAFQIQDDILNLVGEEFAKGKGIGEDIHEGKRTLMVIHCLKHAPKKKAQRLKKILALHTNDRKLIAEAIEIIKSTDSIDYAKNFARKIVAGTWQEVDKVLPECDAKHKLKAFADYLIERTI